MVETLIMMEYNDYFTDETKWRRDLLYVEKKRDGFAYLYFADGNIQITKRTLKQIEFMGPPLLLRTNINFLVNFEFYLDYIHSTNYSYEIILNGTDRRIPLSNNYMKKISKYLKKWYK